SEWCVATSFYQSSANHVSFYPLLYLRNLFYLIRATDKGIMEIRRPIQHRDAGFFVSEKSLTLPVGFVVTPNQARNISLL
ncbi:MAG: hypothetical protein E7E26_04595, partial [Clostridiales bacterium]|nr:hypothetical protein [Clostridiales bacterium]